MGYVVNKGTKGKPKFYGRFRDETGKWRQKKTGQTSEAQALRLVCEWEAAIARGDIGLIDPTPEERVRKQTAKTITVQELCDRFTKEVRRKIYDLDAYKRRCSGIVHARIRPYAIANKRVVDLAEDDVRTWRDGLRPKYAASSVNVAHITLNTIFNWAIDQRILTCRNPCRDVELLPTKPCDDIYSTEEMGRLLALPDLPIIVRLAAWTGARIGELQGLLWSKVHIDDDEARLAGNVPHIFIDKSRSGPTKSRADRLVPLHPDVVPFLRQWRNVCPKTDLGVVFPVSRGWEKGYRMGYGCDLHGIDKALEDADCHRPDKPFHALRRTLITRMEQARLAGTAISAIVGHSQKTGGRGRGLARTTVDYVQHDLVFLHEELCRLDLAGPLPDGVRRLSKATKRKATAT